MVSLRRMAASSSGLRPSPSRDSTIRGLRTKLRALWQAIERACEKEDFRPRPGPLCSWCSFHAYCPAQGGDPALAAAVVAERAAAVAAELEGAAVEVAVGAA